MIIRVLLIGLVAYYLITRVGKFFFRLMTSKEGEYSGGKSTYQRKTRPQNKGNVHVDYIPRDKNQQHKGPDTTGEYIDYEEVKD